MSLHWIICMHLQHSQLSLLSEVLYSYHIDTNTNTKLVPIIKHLQHSAIIDNYKTDHIPMEYKLKTPCIVPQYLVNKGVRRVLVLHDLWLTSGSGTTPDPGGVTLPDSAASSDSKGFNYLWLIVIVVGLAVLAALIIIIAVIVYRRRQRNKGDMYSRQQRQEDYFKTLQGRGIVNGGHTPDYNDIDVKFR